MWIKACVISFVIAAVFEPLLIPFLRKLKFGQTILEDGPSWHEKKQGTPTMGGIGFILSTTAGFAPVCQERTRNGNSSVRSAFRRNRIS